MKSTQVINIGLKDYVDKRVNELLNKTQMKKHELLKKAYDNYPKGTTFLSAQIGAKSISTGEFDLSLGNVVMMPRCDGGVIYCCDSDKWAEIITEEKPKFIMTSEDGVDLYEGDEYIYVKFTEGKWDIFHPNPNGMYSQSNCITDPKLSKSFHSKENALKWIEEHNKPKTKTLPLYFGQEVIINFDKSEVVVMDGDKEVSALSFGDINDLSVEIKDGKAQT